MYYPLFLDLSATRCLVVGGGEVGLRKAQGLMAAHAQEVLVLDAGQGPAPFGTAWDAMRACPALRLEVRPFVEEDLSGRALVFACTGAREVNAAVATACTRLGIWCNCADAPLEGNCIVPAVLRAPRGGLTAALSTSGASPAWAKVLREDLAEWMRPRSAMTELLGRVRPLVLALKQETGQNREIFRTLARSPLCAALVQGDAAQCEALLRELLPDALHPHIAELLHDLL